MIKKLEIPRSVVGVSLTLIFLFVLFSSPSLWPPQKAVPRKDSPPPVMMTDVAAGTNRFAYQGFVSVEGKW